MASTYFFYDAKSLATVVEYAAAMARGPGRMQIWDAGCAHGAEAFTLAIMLREKLSSFAFRNVIIHASDFCRGFAADVLRGVYSRGETRRVPRDLLMKYFRPTDDPNQFRVVDEIRARIEFHMHDLLSLVPLRTDFNLIVCRDVLSQMDEKRQYGVLRMFHQALSDDGLLAMEPAQRMPGELWPLFEEAFPNAPLYKKRQLRPLFVHAANPSGHGGGHLSSVGNRRRHGAQCDWAGPRHVAALDETIGRSA